MKKNIPYLLLLLLLCFVIIGCDDNQTNEPPTNNIVLAEGECAITGKVTSKGIALENAIIEIANTSDYAKSNSNGNFLLRMSKTDEIIYLEVSKTGFNKKVVKITKDNFVNDVATIDIELLTDSITIKGNVKDSNGNPLSNVEVSIDGLNTIAKTDSKGAYTLEVERLSGYELIFYKDYYQIVKTTLDNVNGENELSKDVVLNELEIVLTGKVSNAYEGNISGALVSIVGTDYSAISDANGNYRIENIDLGNMNFEISVSKEGYLNSVYPSDCAENLELIKDYVELPQVGEAHKFDAYVTKSSDGFYFKFYVDSFTVGVGSKEEKIQIFINPGEYTENNRMKGSHTAEIALCSNQDIVVVVNYINGAPDYITDFDLGEEVIYESIKLDDGRTELNCFFKYSLFRDYFGTEFAIDYNSVVGLNITSWSDFLEKPAEGWVLEELPGIDGKALVDHDNPQDWPRLSSDGTYIYEYFNNSEVEMYENVVSGVVTCNGEPLNGVLVTNSELGIEAYTNENGEYTVNIPKEKFYLRNVELKYSKDGYVDVCYVIGDFINGITTKNVELVVGNSMNSVTGKVINSHGEPISNATVSIVNTNYSVKTDEYGLFELIGIDVSLPYTLIIEKEGYKTFENNINQTTLTLGVVTLSKAPVYLGTLGKSEYKVSVLVENDQMTITYLSNSSNADKTEIIQYLNFGDSGIYEVRFKAGWTGVWSWGSLDWKEWDDRIQLPSYSWNGNQLTITQNIELSYFEDLGVDISNIKIAMCEDFENYLNYNDKIILNLDNIDSWAQIVGESSEEETSSPYTYLGTLGTTNIKAYYNLVGSMLKMYYVTETTTIGEINQYFTFDGVNVYEVRFKEGWTGIWNCQTASWVSWNEKVSNPTYSLESDGFEITQVIDLTYFSDLGIDISSIKILLSENFENYLVYNDETDLSTNDKSSWPSLSSKQITEYIPNGEYLGYVGNESTKVYYSMSGNKLTMTYVTLFGFSTEVYQYITFGNGKIYDIRFKEGWTGIYNFTDSKFETWNDKVENPIISIVGDYQVWTQTINLTYFTDLGISDLSNPKLIIQANDLYINYKDQGILSFENQDSWIELEVIS